MWGGTVTLHRIKAVRDFGEVKSDEVGGWIEKEENLSHDGECWVSSEAIVCNNAKVVGDAKVGGHALVKDNAQIGLKHRDAIGVKLASGLLEQCSFPEDSLTPVFEMDAFGSEEKSKPKHVNLVDRRTRAKVIGRAAVCDNAKVCDYAEVRDNAVIGDNALILDKSTVCQDAIVEGNVIVKDTACIGSAARISGTCATTLDSRMWGKRYSNSQYRDQLEFTE